MSSPRYKWTFSKSETFENCIQKAKDERNTSYFKKLGQVLDDLATSDWKEKSSKIRSITCNRYN